MEMLEKLTALADSNETEQPLVSLDNIRQAARQAKQVQSPHEREMDENLLRWAEKYWKSRGYDDSDAISMLIYY